MSELGDVDSIPKHMVPLKAELRDLVLTLNDGSKAQVLSTKLYTVIQPFWSTEWIYKVYAAENEIGRAICGWPTQEGKPCKNIPVAEDKIEDVTIVGKCGLHSRPQTVTEVEDVHIRDVSFESYGEITELPSYKLLISIADSLLPSCNNCDFRFKCKDRDETLGKCTVQRNLAEKFLVGIIKENKLVEITDMMLAFTLVQSFVDYVKTLQYEAYSGLSDTVSGGWMGLRMQLNRLIQQNMRALAVDRKTRIFFVKDGVRSQTDLDISRLLSGDESREIVAESRSMTVTSVKTVPHPRTFQGVDGELIIDQEVDLDNDDGE